jgi:hypothetical protein
MATNAYEIRDAILTDMGYRSYADYLLSGLWQKIRSGVLSKDVWCAACGERAREVHHRSYTRENLSGESSEGLVSICGTCHESIELNGQHKRTLEAANAVLDSLVTKKPVQMPAEIRSDQGRSECSRCGKPIARSQSYCWQCSKVVYGGKRQRKLREEHRPTNPPVRTVQTKSVWRG